MSVEATDQIRERNYSLSTDQPGGPIGAWFGNIGVTGDGSSNTARMHLSFGRALRQGGLLYSLEQFHVAADEGRNQSVVIETQNMDSPGPSDSQYIFKMLFLGPLVRTILDAGSYAGLLPWFLGSPGAGSGLPVLAAVLENTNTVVYRFSAQGYIWSQKARSAPGGPVRPVGGLYRA